MSEALRDHLQRTGVPQKLLKNLHHTALVVENRLGVSESVAPYAPFGEHFAHLTPDKRRQEAADFVVDTIDHTRNLHAKQKEKKRILSGKGNVKVPLLHEKELQRRGLSVLPNTHSRNPLEKSAFPFVSKMDRQALGMYHGDLRF